MSRKFKISPIQFEDEIKLYVSNEICFDEGVNILVGCNGIGKTTLMNLIQDELMEMDIPYYRYFDKEIEKTVDRGAVSSIQFFNNYLTRKRRSEGENIGDRLSMFATDLGNFVRTNSSKDEIWLFIDSLDSGMSIDAIQDILDFIDSTMLTTLPDGMKMYIVMSANSYEVVRWYSNSCIDTYNLKPIKFKDYQDYATFILKTRKYKDSRYEEK